ncbi:MAG: amidohydrolase family protein [Thermodesulfobacteriota bacterium]
MLVDAHCHIFTPRIVENVRSKPDMVDALKLDTVGAWERLSPEALQRSAESNRLSVCVLLPTAGPDKVRSENDRFIGIAERFPRLRTLATLHPDMKGVDEEIRRMCEADIRGFKFSSFSQRFDPASPRVQRMLAMVESLGQDRGALPVCVLDTFAGGGTYFRADPDHLTTPAKLAELVRTHQGINFVAAHMGGLLADFDEVRRSLPPARNLYLDTANAAHTLERDQFITLLRIHGAAHMLFGTDWPWFVHATEVPKIAELLARAGYSPAEQAEVFGKNAARLFGL